MDEVRQLSNELHLLPVPLPLEPNVKWKPHPLFRGSTSNIDNLSCHMSGLVLGHSPHPPHDHPEEELLIVLANNVNIVLPTQEPRQMSLRTGEFVYYPAGFSHTITGASDAPANYLMFKWRNDFQTAGSRLQFLKFEAFAREASHEVQSGWRARALFEDTTHYLSKLHCHVSQLDVDAGYNPHIDSHDVAMVLFEGEVETLERRLSAPSVIFHPAGELHGIRNAGTQPARYLVFEFHRNGKSNSST